MAKESFATIAKRRLLGLAFIVVLIGLVTLSVAFYNKAFTPVTMVTLRTDHTGNQLLKESDVKERGIIVGSVRSVHSTGDGAIIKLAIQPGRTKIIPANVSAQILPKTLFGEQYVSLVIPPDPVGQIKKGDTIPQDRSAVALETERVLGDFLPLLQAVKPAELNATLTAVATALTGRGTELGNTLKNMDAYLRQFNPAIPKLVDDLKNLGNLSDELVKATPDLIATLDNFQTGARTVIDKKAALDQILTQADATSNLFNSFLQENQSRLITIVSTSDSIYRLLNQYSPEYGCMLEGLSKYFDRANKGITHHQIQLSAQLYLATPNYGAYTPANKPFYLTGVGPNCLGIPNPQVPFVVPGPLRCVSDGATVSGDASCDVQNKISGRDQQSVGSAAETAQVNTILASTLDTTPDNVPGVATLLLAPSLRGQVVTVK
jgi:phospholipid/cholesterol/gamma-HCH transport system substrate-binding protein